jgi:Domain of unknown function (DUF4062)/NB-ARC domain
MNKHWLEQPIFISSTFKDMHKERDYLKEIVFPGLETELLKQYKSVLPIDLRGSIVDDIEASEEEVEKQILQLCLSEIKRSGPIMIVLLGDRYGWIPPEEVMRKIKSEYQLTFDYKGLSVTELEIKYALLQAKYDNVFIYFRESNNTSEIIKEESEITKVKALKEELKSIVPEERIRFYKEGDYNNLGDLIKNDILVFMTNESNGKEYNVNNGDISKAILLHKYHQFVPDKQFPTQAILDYLDTDNTKEILQIKGELGIGKTTLLAVAFQHLIHKTDVVVLLHLSEINNLLTSLKNWISILEKSDQIKNYQDNFSELVHVFNKYKGNQKIIFLLDGISLDEYDLLKAHGFFSDAKVIFILIPNEHEIFENSIKTINIGFISKAHSHKILKNLILKNSRNLSNKHKNTMNDLCRNDLKEKNKFLIQTREFINGKPYNPALIKFFMDQAKVDTTPFQNPLWINLAYKLILLMNEDNFVNVTDQNKAEIETEKL